MDGTPNIDRHSSTTADDLEQKIFISTRFTAKDLELRSRDSRGQASVQYSITGKHLDNNRFKQEAQLPLRNRASATYYFVAKLISIAHSCL